MQSDSHTFSKPLLVCISVIRILQRESHIFLHFRKGLKLSSGVKESRQKGGRMTLKLGEVNEGWIFTSMLLLFLEASDLDHHSFTASHSMEFLYKTRICFKYAYASEQRRAEREAKRRGKCTTHIQPPLFCY